MAAPPASPPQANPPAALLGADTPEPYPPIERLGVIGDRRSAAVIGPHGTIEWLCLPEFDGTAVFGRLLDSRRGGWWQLGPAVGDRGAARYVDGSNVLVTRWAGSAGRLELRDAMLAPAENGGAGRPRLLRRLRCRSGTVRCTMRLFPRAGFDGTATVSRADGGFVLRLGTLALALWSSRPAAECADGVAAAFTLRAGEDFWAVLEAADSVPRWSVGLAAQGLRDTLRYWRRLTRRYRYAGPRRRRVMRSALAIELLSFAPTGALAAAATTSLPERIGGDRNYDYRFAWIRDASMAIATLSVLGDVDSAERYLSWLAQLDSATKMPLQVLYRLGGETEIRPCKRADIDGYRGSRPVRLGNHAWAQRQIDGFGYLADCALIYLAAGGQWEPHYWALIERIAEYAARTWREPSHGIWERCEVRHYVSSKVMTWTALHRALLIAERRGIAADLGHWRRAMHEIHAEVMRRGWSKRLGAFRQHYDADSLDASTLLIPLMGFLPAGHPRVAATVRRIEGALMRDGLVYRFRPEALPGQRPPPLGDSEGAFLPCCCWLADVYARLGRRPEAEAMLDRIEALSPLGLLSEEADGRALRLLGNLPMIFSHAEYGRAVLGMAGLWPRFV